MKTFIYYHNKIDIADNAETGDVLVVTIPACDSFDELLSHLSKYLNFPDYFGQNIDALWDCINTLEGVSQKKIVIVHRGPLNLSQYYFERYIPLMFEAMNIWDMNILHEPPLVDIFGPTHYLDIAFPESMKWQIEQILARENQNIIRRLDAYLENLERHRTQAEKRSSK